MPFIGNQPALSYTSFAKQDFTTSATTSYTLDHPVTNENEIALFINFVRQEPGTAYTASNTNLNLTSATSASDDMYCVFLGKAVQTVNPPAGSVGASQISDGSIALGKLSATGTKDATTFLRGDNTFASAGGDNTPMASGYLNASQTVTNNTFTKVQYNAEYYDTDSAFDTSTYRFTVPSGKGGKYLVHASLYCFGTNNDEREFGLDIYKNGAIAYRQFMGKPGFQATYPSDTTLNTTTIVNLSAADYIEFYGMVRVNSGTPSFFGSSTLTNIYSYFNIAKMID